MALSDVHPTADSPHRTYRPKIQPNYRLDRKRIALATGTHVIEIALNHVHIAGQGLEIIVGLLGAQIAGAEYVLDSIGHQNLFELRRQIVASERYVEIAQNEHQLALSDRSCGFSDGSAMAKFAVGGRGERESN